MAQVPYQPYSSVEPAGGSEQLSVSTPSAAFGANVGAALQGLGATTEQVGGELFTRAMALQDLRNETDAREAQATYMEKASLLHADYNSKEGTASVDGLQGYIKAQKDLRESIRGSLKTQYAQRYYDRDTLPFMQRNVFSAASKAGEEGKRSAIGTAQAQKDIAAKTFVDPKSNEEFQHKLGMTDSADDTIAGAKGLTPDQTDDLKMQSQSRLWLGRIGQVAHDDPQAAFPMLDTARKAGQLTQDDYEKALLITRAQNRAIGSANLANSVYSPDKTAKQMEDEVKSASPKLAHDDPLFEKDAIQALKGKITTDRYIANQDKNTGIQKVMEAVQKGVVDVRELRLDPQMAATIDALPADARERIPGMINSYNAARDKHGQEENFTALTGLYYNDREAFLDADFTKYNLSQEQQRSLMAKRAQAIAKPADDPMLNRAMGWLRQGRAAELRALGIYFRPTEGADATAYDHYTGALQAGIDAWREEKGRPPGHDDIVNTIGPAVIHQRTEPGTFGMFFGGTKRPAFDRDMSVVKKWANDKGIVNDIVAKGGFEPTDEELYRAYLRSQFIDLYSKPKDTSGGGPTVPQSK